MKRTLGLAAVFCAMLALTGAESRAQNLEAGKSPGQIFSATCTACHRSPRGLLRSVPPSSLPSFLREHYTTSRDMAQQLSGFLIANGATDPRARQDIRNPDTRTPQEARRDPRQDPKSDSRQDPRAEPRQAQPDGRSGPQPPGAIPQQENRPGEVQQAARPDAATIQPDGRVQTVDPRSHEGRRLARQAARDAAASRPDRRQKNRMTPAARIEAAKARGRDALPLGDVLRSTPAVEVPAVEAAKPASRPDAAGEALETVRPEPVAPPSAPTAVEVPLRADPVPPVTPAPAPNTETRATPAPPEPRPRTPVEETASAPSKPAEPPPAAAPAPAPSSPPLPPISQ